MHLRSRPEYIENNSSKFMSHSLFDLHEIVPTGMKRMNQSPFKPLLGSDKDIYH